MTSTLGKRARAPEICNDLNPTSPQRRSKRRTRCRDYSTSQINDSALIVDQKEIQTQQASPPREKICSSGASTPSRRKIRSHGFHTQQIHDQVPLKSSSQPVYEDPAEDKENNRQLPTPTTPRHRDALSKRIQLTPRARRFLGGPCTPRTPQTPRTGKKRPSVYDCARQLLKDCDNSPRLIARDSEREELRILLQSCKNHQNGRSVYISGPPGTGKSTVVKEVCNDFDRQIGIRSVYINCMSVSSSRDLCCQLLEELSRYDQDPIVAPSSRNLESELFSFLSSLNFQDNNPCVVVLDEVDHLINLDPQILYKLVEWSSAKKSHFVLLAIANALDLTDRLLPKFKATKYRPQLLPFMPYSADQIESIITFKLRSLIRHDDHPTANEFIPFISPPAIKLCAKKVAAYAGDLRKAFDIVHRTIDAIESEVQAKEAAELEKSPSKHPLAENANFASRAPVNKITTFSSLATLTPLTAPRATIAHVSRVAAMILGNGTSRRLQTLNLQQKAALLALIALRKLSIDASSTLNPTESVNPTLKALYQRYKCWCVGDSQLRSLAFSEFADVVSGLVTSGLICEIDCKGSIEKGSSTKRGKGGQKRLQSLVSRQELDACLTSTEESILSSWWQED